MPSQYVEWVLGKIVNHLNKIDPCRVRVHGSNSRLMAIESRISRRIHSEPLIHSGLVSLKAQSHKSLTFIVSIYLND